MLQYFLANWDRMVNRDEIIEAILPGSRYHGANYFNVVPSSLRKALKPGLSARSQSRYILRDEDRYRLDTSDISLDVKEFDALSSAASARDKEAVIPSLLALEALYAGDFMTDYPYESYLEEKRERLRKRYMKGLLEIARYYKSCKDIPLCW